MVVAAEVGTARTPRTPRIPPIPRPPQQHVACTHTVVTHHQRRHHYAKLVVRRHRHAEAAIATPPSHHRATTNHQRPYSPHRHHPHFSSRARAWLVKRVAITARSSHPCQRRARSWWWRGGRR